MYQVGDTSETASYGAQGALVGTSAAVQQQQVQQQQQQQYIAQPQNQVAMRVQYLTPFPLTGPECMHAGYIYRLANKRDCLAFRSFADSLLGYELKYQKPGEILVWEKKLPNEPMHVIKVCAVFCNQPGMSGNIVDSSNNTNNTSNIPPGVTPRLLYDMLQDAVFREQWDPYREDAFRIVRLNQNNDIGYYAGRSPTALVTNRDFVNQRAWHEAGRNEFVIFNTSVPHTAVSRKYQKEYCHNRSGQYIRGQSKMSGYFIQPWISPMTGREDGVCFTFITQCDPGGWIPASITNYISTKYAPNTVDTVANALRAFRTWLPEQLARGTYVKDWDVSPEWWLSPEEERRYTLPSETRSFARRLWYNC